MSTSPQDHAEATAGSTTDKQPSIGVEDMESKRWTATALSEKSLEELLLSFWIDRSFQPPVEDPHFRFIDQLDHRYKESAVEENRAIMDELRRRDPHSKETLLKYRDRGLIIYTGPSGPNCTVPIVCRTLLGEYDIPGQPMELTEF